MRAILVSVDFGDLLAITLPRNRHHFDEVVVVTVPHDHQTIKVAHECGAQVFTTLGFYDDGAAFNKWKALEQGLDWMGRRGWLCLMDADVIWPHDVWLPRYLRPGFLYTPRRYMLADFPRKNPPGRWEDGVPPETEWHKLPLHPQDREWAGYTQVFHAADPVLGSPPWHQTDWRHAGGADSFFQAKWIQERKVRPAFRVLHLGPSGVNWCGRATTYADGTLPPGAGQRVQQLQGFLRGRMGKSGEQRFSHEKLK